MTTEYELQKVAVIIREAEDLTGEDALNADKHREVMAGLDRAEAVLRRMMTDYATEETNLSVSQVYLASDLLERLHEARHNLPSPPN